MNKQTKVISNAWEAEENIIVLMKKQDSLRLKRWYYADLASKANNDEDYQQHFEAAVATDSELFKIEQEIISLANFLPMPQL